MFDNCLSKIGGLNQWKIGHILLKKSVVVSVLFTPNDFLPVGGYRRLVVGKIVWYELSLKLVSHQTISPPTTKSADFSGPKKSADFFTNFFSSCRWVLSVKIGGNPPILVSHQKIWPPTKIQKSVGPYTNQVRSNARRHGEWISGFEFSPDLLISIS